LVSEQRLDETGTPSFRTSGEDFCLALYLTESQVRSLLTMPLALEGVEDSFRRLANGSAMVHPRRRVHIPGQQALMNYMAGADGTSGYMGLKIYTVSRTQLRFLVLLFETATGDLAAIIEADYLGQLRTGAASGVATRHMAREDAHDLAVIGTGLQARTQVQAIAAVRKLRRIRVLGRDPEKRARFAREIESLIAVRTEAVDTAEKAVRDADIIVTATASAKPVLEGAWISPGAHVNAIGSNFPNKSELDQAAVNRASIVAVDSLEQSQIESGELILAFGSDPKRWQTVVELSQIVAGRAAGRTNPDQITLFKSNGIATEDIVVGGRLYELAKARGVGTTVSLWGEAIRNDVSR
jgi:alanine dehydrogenase